MYNINEQMQQVVTQCTAALNVIQDFIKHKSNLYNFFPAQLNCLSMEYSTAHKR